MVSVTHMLSGKSAMRSERTVLKVMILAAHSSVIEIPEILAEVFEGLPPSSKAAAACVCRQWSEIVLDKLWRDLDSVIPLFNLVGRTKILSQPMQRQKSELVVSSACV